MTAQNKEISTMKRQQTLRTFTFVFTLLTALALTVIFAQPVSAQTEKTLHNFNAPGEAGGQYPNGGLILDSAGNLYGTTAASSNSCTESECGTVFELVLNANGTYTEKVLHTFSSSGKNAWNPQAGVAMDASGNLYGTTYAGGANGAGTVYKLTLSDGVWKETLLHSFGASDSDGAQPVAAVILDAAGNLYGTTQNGGGHNYGAVYEVSPKTGGGWTEQVLHSFRGPDGEFPGGPLLMDAAGNLYGTAGYGGTSEGTAFKLSPDSACTVLFNFSASPFPYLAMDAAGNLYGTGVGGPGNGGILYQLSPPAFGQWTQQILYTFCTETSCPVGPAPIGVIFDKIGNLYGVAMNGGPDTYGTAVELSQTGGTWTATLLHSFGNSTDGAEPQGQLVIDSAGSLYGSTIYGGTHGFGTVFEITP
jgi:uncharacterized repeat protein (TIGR03803 family)